jgi:hypothetical protein
MPTGVGGFIPDCAPTHAAAAVAQTGHLHFGVILGWSVIGSIAIYWVTSMLSGIDSSTRIDLYNTCCLLGYGMLPMCMFAALDLVIPE